jgi:DNA polymerase-3 subunit beta
MKFSAPRDALIKPLTLVAGVVERRNTMAVLSNVLLRLSGNQLTITGSDTEVELVGRLTLPGSGAELSAGASETETVLETTLPARKFLDIIKSLPEGSDIQLAVSGAGRATLSSGRSRFTLSTLPATEFPEIPDEVGHQSFVVAASDLRRLIDRTAFAMAQQDVRYYLNGMLWEIHSGRLRCVATDGHRLAICTLEAPLSPPPPDGQVILPRKGVLELSRLLHDQQDEVEVVLGANHLRVKTSDFSFTSKLVDGRFPDYQRVLPQNASNVVQADRQLLRQAFSRAAILSNEKYRGIRLRFETDRLEMVANNPEQEQAEEEVAVSYQGEPVEIGFNVGYLLDVLGVLSGEQIKLSLADANTSALLEESDEAGDSLYVVMPMRL